MRPIVTLVALAVVGQLLGTTSECAAKPKRASRAKARTAPMASKLPSTTATASATTGEPAFGLAPAAPPAPERATSSALPDASGSERPRVGLLLGVGFPRPLAAELLVKANRYVAFGAEASMAPEIGVSTVHGSLYGVAGDLRVFPVPGPFFIGVRGGYQRMTLKTTVALPPLGARTDAAFAETTYVNPRLGVLWTHRSGFSLGADVGVQIPITSRYTSSVPKEAAEADAILSKVASAFGNGVTPTVDLLRVGFLF